MTKINGELARLEQMILRLSRVVKSELENIDRRMIQYQQALLELNAALPPREDMPPTMEEKASRKP